MYLRGPEADCSGVDERDRDLSTVVTEPASPPHFIRLLRVCDQAKSRPSHLWRVPVALRRGVS